MTTHDKLEAAKRYINRIRNPSKQQYARDYWSHVAFGRPVPNDRNYDCSYMAKQSVRLQLLTIADIHND